MFKTEFELKVSRVVERIPDWRWGVNNNICPVCRYERDLLYQATHLCPECRYALYPNYLTR